MNSVILNGNVIGTPKVTQTKDGQTKANLTVRTDGRDMPLNFSVIAFGRPADTASHLIEGDEVLISGRMVASAVTKTMAITANAIEFLFDEPETSETPSTEKSL
jgi:single-stranded DNA-binding protein